MRKSFLTKLKSPKYYLPALVVGIFIVYLVIWVIWAPAPQQLVVVPSPPAEQATPFPSISPSSSPSPSPSPQPSPSPVTRTASLFSRSVFSKKISAAAQYSKEDRIGTIRPTLEPYAVPIYRTVDNNLPLVKVVNKYGGRTEHWPIPRIAEPASGVDHQMSVMHRGKGVMYDFWDAQWQGDGSILAGGMKDFPINGDGLSHPKNHRVTSSGFAGTAGAIILEDFSDGSGKLNPQARIPHALVIFIPHQLIKKDAFIPPALMGEATADNTGDIPLGTRYALPKSVNVESLDVHPFTKSMARSLQEYGAYVSDRNNSGQYKGKYVSTVKVEAGLLKKVYGKGHDELGQIIQKEMYDIIQKYGLYRVSE